VLITRLGSGDTQPSVSELGGAAAAAATIAIIREASEILKTL
jgi:hypothetical protein